MPPLRVIPIFDFSAAEALPLEERVSICLELAKNVVARNGYQEICDFPCVPDTGAANAELQELEATLSCSLPHEYRYFLSRCRYLKLDDGREIGGLSHSGLYVTGWPWLSNRHKPDTQYLVFANYWRYADGDQLLIDPSSVDNPVIAYLHEHGPLFEEYAPSFSLALWRLIHETEQ